MQPPARVVKLVDTRDLKSLGLWLYGFDSRPGHHFSVSGSQKYPLIRGYFFAFFECVQPSAKPATAESKYSTLATLKKLLDDGAITQEEYLREKDKILR